MPRIVHQLGARSGLICALHTTALVLCLSTLPGSRVQAGAPEYMQLHAKAGMALEIEGTWDSLGAFVAENIEILPNPRSPKLRGTVKNFDAKTGVMLMYGQRIAVPGLTEFVEDGGGSSSANDLKAGRRIEVTCKVDSLGAWSARKITTQGIKQSDKIKGTITRVHLDGEAPDTLDMSGLLILLVNETDILDAEGSAVPSDKELLDDLGRGSIEDIQKGWTFGRAVHGALEYRLNAYDRSEYDLTTSADTDELATNHQVRALLSVYASNSLRFHASFRLQKILRHINEQNVTDDDLQAYFSELYALFRPPGLSDLMVMVGRQRFRDPREWLFDEYLDAVRILYRASVPLVCEAAVIHAVHPIKDQFSTWTDLYFAVRWYTNDKSQAAGYVLARRDSDEARKRQPVWMGVHYSGEVNRFVQAWADLSAQRGEDKFETVEAWAVDLGTTLSADRVPLRPALTLGYAAASGDDTGADDIDHTFRQTAYEDNAARLGGLSRTKYYGNVLDPELSNLQVITAGVGVRPTRRSSLELVYHSYAQSEADTEVKGADLLDPPARPNGVSTELGWALDMVIRLPTLWDTVSLRWTSALFSPGAAFEPRQETAFLNQINVTVKV